MALVALALAGCGVTPSPPAAPTPAAAVQPSATPLPTAAPTLQPATATVEPTPEPASLEEVFVLVSQEQLFGYLKDLEAIQPYSGWRSAATQGEVEARDYVADTLGSFGAPHGAGMALERQQFRVPSATELWETRVHLTLGGQEVEVPADGVRGHRDNMALALRSDSDGRLNDTDRDRVVLEGPVVPVGSSVELERLSSDIVAGRVVFFDNGDAGGQVLALADLSLLGNDAGCPAA